VDVFKTFESCKRQLKINLDASQHTKFCHEGPLAAKMCTSLLETAWNGEAWHVTKPVLSHPTSDPQSIQSNTPGSILLLIKSTVLLEYIPYKKVWGKGEGMADLKYWTCSVLI
jgi:hypothetical protein